MSSIDLTTISRSTAMRQTEMESTIVEDSRLVNAQIGLANGTYTLEDMTFFQSWNRRRHCRTHIFCGLCSIVFGFLVVLNNPFEKPNYGTQVIAGILYVLAGVFSIGFGTARATAVTCCLTTIVGIFIIIEILVLFQDEAGKLNEIWKTREGAGGLWALLGCLIISGFEVVLGFSAFGAWLRYNDMVDRFKARNQEIELGITFPEIYGHLLSKWNSSESGLNKNRKSMASYGDFSGEDEEIEGDDGDDGHADHELEVDNYAEMDAEMEIAMNEMMDVDDGMDDNNQDYDNAGDI